jgi:hypothetical protein
MNARPQPSDFSHAAYEEMGSTLLAAQPPTPQRDAKKELADWLTIYAHLEQRLAALRTWRWSWWVFWAVLAAFFIPFRYLWLVTANRTWRGGNLNQQILNSRGVLAARTCAAGMWTGLCSPSRPWFKLGIGTPWLTLDRDGKAWLKDTEDKIYTVLHQSNFYTTMAQAFQDLTVFGTAPPLIMEDAEDVIRLYLPAAGEYYLGNGPRLEVDTHYCEFNQTVLGIVGMFTLESCPQQIQKLWYAGTYDMEYVVARAIEPNFDLARRGTPSGKVKVVPGKWTYREVYWLKGFKTNAPLSRRGYNEKPFMALRWATVSNDAYGRGPGMDAICDVKQNNTQTYREAEFLEKGVRPPMGADVELKNEPASIMPGMTTFMNTAGGQQKKFWPLFEVSPQWLAGLNANTTKVETRIDQALYVSLFMAISQMEGVQPRNELELTKRDLERLQELGPVITLAEKEFDVLIHRVIEILRRRNLLMPLPQSLQNAPLKINYVSILRLAQRSAESVAMKDCFQTGGELSSAAKAAGVPDPLRVLNLDKAYRKYCELNNMEPDLLYTEDEVTEHDHIRAKATQQAQAPQQAMSAVTAAKTLSETALPGGNTALGALVGGPGAGAQGGVA